MTLQDYRQKNQSELEKSWLKLTDTQREDWGNFTHFVFSKWATREQAKL
jgi:hypothetical protein